MVALVPVATSPPLPGAPKGLPTAGDQCLLRPSPAVMACKVMALAYPDCTTILAFGPPGGAASGLLTLRKIGHRSPPVVVQSRVHSTIPAQARYVPEPNAAS